MLKLNSKLRAEARESLAGKWKIGVIIALIYFVIIGGSLCMWLFIGTILVYGKRNVYLKSFRGESPEIGDLFAGFRNYGSVLGTMVLMYLYIFLWSLLLIVPGIIKAYSYAMTPYILHDEPTLGAEKTICKSMEMMDGHKMKLFLLDLSFIGWALLCLFTAGIGYLWLIPYVQSARAAFYEDIKNKNTETL